MRDRVAARIAVFSLTSGYRNGGAARPLGLLFLLGLGAAVLGCAHGSRSTRAGLPGHAQGVVYYYGDDRGLSVVTAGARAEQRVSERTSVSAQGLVDRIFVTREQNPTEDTSGGLPGRALPEVDIVTSASVSAAGGNRLVKNRSEGTLGAEHELASRATPTRVNARLRVSAEPDYRSYAGRFGFESELFQRNTTLGAFVGYGQDRVTPFEAPAGHAAEYPATHQRWNLGLSASQILSPRLMLMLGSSLSDQFGALSNPYRRARVRETLVAERLPEHRLRATAFVALSWYLGWGTALHTRSGIYLDSWDIQALIPEAAVVKELGERGLLSLRYRYYFQTAASFYERRYAESDRHRTGDARLGPMSDHQPGFELSWTVLGLPDRAGSLTLLGGYDLSLLEYRAVVDGTVTAHSGRLAVSGAY